MAKGVSGSMLARFVFTLLAAFYAFTFDDPGDAGDFADALFAFVGLGDWHGDFFGSASATAFHFAATFAAFGGGGGHVLADGLVFPASELFFFEGDDRFVDFF
jgi:hypothetical protein